MVRDDLFDLMDLETDSELGFGAFPTGLVR